MVFLYDCANWSGIPDALIATLIAWHDGELGT